MILCEFTPAGGTMQRISTEDIALEYQWFSYIQSIASIKLQLPKKHGGFAAPTFSDISLSPEMFIEIGSYPATATVRLIETDTDEAGGKVIFDGTATLDTYDRQSIRYILKKPDLPAIMAASTAYNDTLINVVTSLCDAAILDLTIDTSMARATSPAVLYTTTAEQLAIDLVSGMCAWFSHAVKISEGTLYLIDMLGTRTPHDLTEFDVQRCDYAKNEPIALIKCGDETLEGSNGDGEEYDVGTAYHSTPANIQTALTDIKTILDMDIATIRFKADQSKPGILDQLTLTDESLVLPVTTSGTVGSIIYNYDTLAVEVEVYGSVTV